MNADMRNNIYKYILLTILFIIIPSYAFAQDSTCEASLDKDKIRMGEDTILSVIFYEVQDMPAPELSHIDNFNSRYLNSMNIVVKKGYLAVKSIKHRYVLSPKETGDLSIQPMKFEFKERVYETQPLKIKVEPALLPEKLQSAIVPAQSVAAEKEAFARIITEKTNIYLNQEIPIEVKFYVNKKKISLTDVEYPALQHDNFSIAQFQSPKRLQQAIEGDFYDVLIFENFLFPMKTGRFNLGPGKIKCNLLVKQKKPSFDASGAITDSEYEYIKRPVEFIAPSVPIEVMDFPKENKPSGFSNIVGDFSFNADVSPTEAKLAEVLTLSMKVTGAGNLSVVTAPGVIADGFKIYKPEVATTKDSKIFKQVLIPEQTGVLTINKISFTFFNPNTQGYNQITKGPFQIKVYAAQEEFLPENIKAGRQGALIKKEAPYSLKEDLGRDIIYIKDSPGPLKQKGSYLYDSKLFLISQGFPLFAFIGIFLIQRHRERLKYNPRYARYISAFKRAKKGLNKAKPLFDTSKKEQFYIKVLNVLQIYLGDKFYLAPAGITIGSVNEIAKNKKLDDKTIKLLEGCFAQHDKALFIPSDIDREDMVSFYKNVSNVISAIERQAI